MQDGKLIYEAQTPNGKLEVIEAPYNGRPARVLYSGVRQTAQSGQALDDLPELLFDYNQRLFELFEGLRPQRVLLIGGGACTLARAMLRVDPTVQLDIVELERTYIDIGRDFFGFVPGSRTAVSITNGEDYLARTDELYDLILVDVFIGDIIPAAFQTPKLAHLLADHLRPGGVVAVNIIASYYGDRSRALTRQVTALRTAFSGLQLYPAGHEPSLWLPQNFILTAQNGQRPLQQFVRYQALRLPAIDTSSTA